MALLRLREVSKRYGACRALHKVSVEVTSGGFYLFRGPNGAGKSTLFRCAMGMERPDSGVVEVDGTSIASNEYYQQVLKKYRPSYLGPDHALYAHLSVEENLLLRAQLSSREDAKGVTADCVERFSLSVFAKKRLSECSQGMQRRAALAACFVASPSIVFLDEPFVNLDTVSAELMQQELLSAHALGVTVCLATHASNIELPSEAKTVRLDQGKVCS